ncbi:hypothetical protein BpHYR1_034796 [Brachionus plicatilis]|uniref:Uncharacterized protein n=1 Tax=Brachionus plicatilis TaxID=10195 RepID=A0A3M7SQR3_BRAPC|nr:hypothetical protein BpHYR1_034796 [Brachionus plicatilis]
MTLMDRYLQLLIKRGSAVIRTGGPVPKRLKLFKSHIFCVYWLFMVVQRFDGVSFVLKSTKKFIREIYCQSSIKCII